MKKLLIVLAEGFEEIEFSVVCDVMRRLGVETVIGGLCGTQVIGSHAVEITADCHLCECRPEDFDALFLPGGMPGSKNMHDSEMVVKLVKKFASSGKIVAAICAAPMVLGRAGLLAGRRFTMYPGMESWLPAGCVPTGAPAESDGTIITGRGPGASFAFAAALAAGLGLDSRLKELYRGMLVEL